MTSSTQRWLLAWELGAGLGHWAGLTAIARQALQHGIEPIMVVPTLSPSGMSAPEGVRVIACPPSMSLAPAGHGTSSMTEALATYGFAQEKTLLPSLRAWRDLMLLLAPDAVVTDHAPCALAVAQALAIPVVQLGTGFAIPPAHEPKLPSFRTWETPDGLAMTRAEINVSQALAAASRALALPRLPQSAAAIYRAPSVLRTLPSLDHYATRENVGQYCGPLEVAGDAVEQTIPAWPDDVLRGERKRVLVYIKADDPLAVPIMQALALRRDVFVHAYIANVQQMNNQTKNLAVHSAPLPLKAMLPGADLLVHHGGAGATSQALLDGVPQLLIPQMAEQFLTGLRLEAQTAGVQLAGQQSTESIARLLDHALTSTALRDGARNAAQANTTFAGDNATRAWTLVSAALSADT
jgi:UDP:flavonoid glycosyltransferase YjiC (YdhE family)